MLGNYRNTLFALIGIGIICCISACTGDTDLPVLSHRDSLIRKIDTLEQRIVSEKSKNQLNKQLAASTMDAYSAFATEFKTDSLTPWYLYRAADLASSALGLHDKAVVFYGKILSDHKKFAKYPDCLFLAGFICQDKLQDGIQAKKYYDELIADYPSHDFVDDAKAMISFFGKSDEDIIKEFEKKNEEKLKK